MGKITLKMTQAAYSAAKKVYNGNATKNAALDELEDTMGMNRGSATDYLNNFRHMMEGKTYKRTFNGEATDYLLENIYLDFGGQALETALSAVKKHLTYYESLGKGALRGIEKVYKKYQKISNTQRFNVFPDQIMEPEKLFEGIKQTITVNSYERDWQAREKCIRHYGAVCAVCSFDFLEKYGLIGKGFIHVHHLIPIAEIGNTYEVNPLKDLRPVCPNCHAMLHVRTPPYSIEELQKQMKKKT